ncbi:MAG: NEW3 domain-containing protein [bacterium]
MVHRILLAVGLALIIGAPVIVLPASAGAAFRGIGLSTPFPTQTVRSGEPATLTLTVKNYGEPPQVIALRVVDVAPGWRASLLGGGRPIGAVSVGPDQDVNVSLRLEPPQGAKPGTYRFRVVAQGRTAGADLPIALTFGQVQASRLALTAELPSQRGPATSSFKYRVTLKNDSDKDLLVNLEAQGPKGAQITFTPAFGSQQVTSVPVKAGESRELDVDVSLPKTIAAGSHPVAVRATSGDARTEIKLAVDVTGRVDLSITGPEGRLSGQANAGRASPLKLLVRNLGGAPARNVEFSASEPSGWEVKFTPERIDEIPASGQQEITASLRPSGKAIAGDYMVNIRANAGDSSASADFRITVLTSTLWGVAGVALVAIALAVVGLAVSRYGRR